MEDSRLRKKIWGNHQFAFEIGDLLYINADYLINKSYGENFAESPESKDESSQMYGLDSLLNQDYGMNYDESFIFDESEIPDSNSIYQKDITDMLEYTLPTQPELATLDSPINNYSENQTSGYSQIESTIISCIIDGFEYSGSSGDMDYSEDSNGYDAGGDSSGGE